MLCGISLSVYQPISLSVYQPITSLWSAIVKENSTVCVILEWFILGAMAKLRKVTVKFVMSVCPSVRPHGTSRLPLDGFS